VRIQTDEQLRADEQVAALVRELNPVRGQPVPPPTVPADELRRRAERRGWRPPVMVRGWLGPATVAVLVVVAVVLSPLFVDGGRKPDRRAAPSGGAAGQLWTPLLFGYDDRPPPARRWLADLATVAAASPDRTGSGRYAYVRTTTWARDTTAAGAAWALREEELWLAADGSGRQRITTTRGPSGRPGEEGPVTTDRPYLAGGLAIVVPAPS